jgi:Family of unknown function (DUF6600)/FecR protein
MYKRIPFQAILVVPLLMYCFGTPPANADVSHARIVRVGVVQGDVRFARDVKGDPLAASNAGWETAALNLPIRQGYVLATDNGRAGVEFENGAMAFLAQNTVLEFYDLSLQDGARTTRLILRQGSAEFYVNPERGEYFSVTGGDFSVQAEGRTTFRLNNFDDGSNVQVLQGRVSVLTKGKATPLAKGQSLSMQAGESGSETIASLSAMDDFDKWVSGRVQTASSANSAALRYSNYGGYISGFGDLYTYGSWFPVAGYGSCWQPFGVGFGWSPFDYGSWYFDPAFGWTFIGSQPWGWLPYHYGGWLSAPGMGWCWNPGGYIGGFVGRRRWRPVTAVWVRSGGLLGLVPIHPMDARGKTPINLSRGVFPVTSRGVSGRALSVAGEKWKVDRKPPRDVVVSQLQAAGPPERIARSMVPRASELRSAGVVGASRESTIMYDPVQHRFVNSESVSLRSGEVGASSPGANGQILSRDERATTQPRGPASMRVMRGRESGGGVPAPIRATPPPRPRIAPPSVPRSTIIMRPGGSYSGSVGGGPRWGGSSGGASGRSFPRSAPAPAPAPAPRAPSGGRPH